MRLPIVPSFPPTARLLRKVSASWCLLIATSRSDWLRAVGWTYREMEQNGVALPVIEAHCNYRRPAHYEDLLPVDVGVRELRGGS